MHTVNLILLLAASVCFLLAAANAPSRVNLVALGLLFWVLVPTIATLRAG